MLLTRQTFSCPVHVVTILKETEAFEKSYENKCSRFEIPHNQDAKSRKKHQIPKLKSSQKAIHLSTVA